MPDNCFSAQELREGGRTLKTNKTPGTDEIEAEFIRIMLSTVLGFNLLLPLFNQHWVTKTVPSAFDLAKVLAVYKKRERHRRFR